MSKSIRHNKKDKNLSSKLDTMMERVQKINIIHKRDVKFDPVKDLGMSIDEYIGDYNPETSKKRFAEGQDRKAGRPCKDVRERLRQYIQSESYRLVSEMKDQSGVEFNFLKRIFSMPLSKGKKKTKRLEKPVINSVKSGTPLVAGTVNIYEFRGRLKVMERLVEIINEMDTWKLEPEEYTLLLWWWCRDAIMRSHEEKRKISLKDMITAFKDERRIFGMINQLVRVRNRVRHVAITAGMDYEKIQSTRPKISLIEMMKDRKKHVI